jgi:hypothetical protein
VPRSRSRARAGTPAARAARAVSATGRGAGRERTVSTSSKIGQLVVFLVALALVALSILSDQLARDENFHARVGWVAFALVAVAAFVVVVPRFAPRSSSGDGPGVDVPSRAHDAALTAASVALGRAAGDRDSRALSAGEPSAALTRAAVDPLSSIELSRRTLASELRRLAAVAGMPATARSLVEYADRLYGARWLSGPEASAIGEVAAVIDAAKASGTVSPAAAQDVDDAVQLLVPVLDERLDEIARQFDQRPPGPAVPYDQLDAADSTEHLESIDEVDELDAPMPIPAAEIGDDPDDDIEIDLRERAAATGPETAGEPRALNPSSPEPVAWRSSS